MSEESADSDPANLPRRRRLLGRASAVRSRLADRSASVRSRAVAAISRKIEAEVETRLTDWPTAVDERIDLAGQTPLDAGPVPQSGHLVLYVHGYLGEGRLGAAKMSGAHQAAALRQAITNGREGQDSDVPAVVAGMWDSSTTWRRAKKRSLNAGTSLANWLDTYADRYDSITVIAHSLGSRVTLHALNELEDATVDSVGLLGAAVHPDAICHEYKHGIESRVEGRVYNYYSANDTIVCRLYRVGEIRPGLGCTGSNCDGGWFSAAGFLPDNFIEVDVSETVHDHLAYYKPDEHVTEGGSCVDEILSNQLSHL